MKRLAGLFFAVLVVTGCAGDELPANMRGLKVGMSREDVLRAVGKPVSTKTLPKAEILQYTDEKDIKYLVVLKEGKVVEFGPAGDFGF